jgi:hypothetical protein
LGIKVGDEIEAEFVGSVSDHDGVGVNAAEDFVSEFEFVVYLWGVLSFRWLGGLWGRVL